MSEWPVCNCLDPQDTGGPWDKPLLLHAERQDTECEAWGRLLELVDRAARDGRAEFRPGPELGAEHWARIVTLPRTIARLTAVTHLNLYGSNLVRLPPEIGEMAALRKFTPYTSYRLHWYPYEITRCGQLSESTVSTRALYGNFKFRPPFPRLPQMLDVVIPARCSVCGGAFGAGGPVQRWISLRVATDVLPLLVHACSVECVWRLPKGAKGYVRTPHEGGLGLVQPGVD